MDLQDLQDLDKPEYEQASDGDLCPKCDDGELKKRYNRSFEGGEFLGCSNFPKCRYTQNL